MVSSSTNTLKFVWVIFIVLFLFTIGFMIATLSTDKWIELKPDSDDDFTYLYPIPPYVYYVYGVDYEFKGSIYKIVDGLSDVRTFLNPSALTSNSLDLEGAPYSRVGCGSCFIIDVSSSDVIGQENWDFYYSWCNMMKRLWFGAGFYITLEIISLVCVVIAIIVSILFVLEKPHFRLAFLSAGGIIICHYLAILVWIGLANATFDDDNCDNLFYSDDNHTPPKVCAKAGPRLSLFILIFLPFVIVPFYIFVFYHKRKLAQSKVTEIKQNVDSEREIGRGENGAINE